MERRKGRRALNVGLEVGEVARAVSIRLPESIIVRLEKIAQWDGTSVSVIVRRCIPAIASHYEKVMRGKSSTVEDTLEKETQIAPAAVGGVSGGMSA